MVAPSVLFIIKKILKSEDGGGINVQGGWRIKVREGGRRDQACGGVSRGGRAYWCFDVDGGGRLGLCRGSRRGEGGLASPPYTEMVAPWKSGNRIARLGEMGWREERSVRKIVGRANVRSDGRAMEKRAFLSSL
jgi:hypothetical protein